MQAFVLALGRWPSQHARRAPTISSRRSSIRRACHQTQCCNRVAPSTTYVQDLRTLAKEIDPVSTDSLVSRMDDVLQKGESPSAPQLEAMVIHLADSRGMARLSLVELFGQIGSIAVPSLLYGLKSCPNPVVRRSCGKALAKIGDSTATGPLLTALVHDEDTVTRSSAAGALAKMGKVAVPPLLDLISNPDVGMTAKGHAAWAIAFMQGDASDTLFESLRHPNRDVRTAVVSALGAVAIGDALPAMGTASDDDWGEGDANKSRMRERAIEAISVALDDESAEVRAEAATALANAGCMDEANKIAGMLTDDDSELRRCAALALMKLGDKSAIGRLRERETDSSEVDSVKSVARLAANYLEQSENEDDWN